MHCGIEYFTTTNSTKTVILIYLIYKYCERDVRRRGEWILDLFGLVSEVYPNLTLDKYTQTMHASYGGGKLGKGPKRVIMSKNWLERYNLVKAERRSFLENYREFMCNGC